MQYYFDKTTSQQLRDHVYDSEMFAAAEAYFREFAVEVLWIEVAHSERHKFLFYRVKS